MQHTTLARARRLSLKFAGAAVLVLSSLVVPASAGNVAIVAAAGSAASFSDAQTKIMASGFFGQVDIIDASTTTPSLAQLQAYTAVIVWSNVNFQNSTLLGDTLADYVDAGGGVVMTVYAVSTTSANRFLLGRWLTGSYPIIVQNGGTTSTGGATLGTVHIPTHPVMNGVTTFSGGSIASRPTSTTMTAGSSVIASWSDGKILIAQHGVYPNRIDLGFYPPSSAVSASWWDQNTDGGKMMANALLYVSNSGTATTPFCLGDGTGAACPCANTGAIGHGCGSSAFAGGAILSSSGNAGASVGTDTLVLTATDIPGPGLFFQANGLLGAPANFGDGHLCAAVGIVRLGVVFPVGNVASYPGGLTPNPIHIQGGAANGNTRHYQCWYRSVPGLCSANNYDLTQGLTLTWGP
ncbi:MAG: hypothetical protein JNL28_07350 [Planctomycetes bacterium]|nr:hypothetical protein [Planctomycetota bacterium]